jgi:transposase InsO family protein
MDKAGNDEEIDNLLETELFDSMREKLASVIGDHRDLEVIACPRARHHPCVGATRGRLMAPPKDETELLRTVALENAQVEKEAHGEFESECPGYCGAQDTFYVGMLKGVRRIYQQTFVDTYSKVAFAKLYEHQTSLTAAELLNNQVVPFFEEHEVPLSRILTDRGTEYCGSPDRHEYELYLTIENIEHTRTKGKSPQTNGIVERWHKTRLNEFYRLTFRMKIYPSLTEL